jgi:hypothetical protein
MYVMMMLALVSFSSASELEIVAGQGGGGMSGRGMFIRPRAESVKGDHQSRNLDDLEQMGWEAAMQTQEAPKELAKQPVLQKIENTHKVAPPLPGVVLKKKAEHKEPPGIVTVAAFATDKIQTSLANVFDSRSGKCGIISVSFMLFAFMGFNMYKKAKASRISGHIMADI